MRSSLKWFIWSQTTSRERQSNQLRTNNNQTINYNHMLRNKSQQQHTNHRLSQVTKAQCNQMTNVKAKTSQFSIRLFV